jgi:hypothetical protein
MEFTTEQMGALAPTFRALDAHISDQSKKIASMDIAYTNLAREIHETLRFIGDKYTDVEKLVETAQHEATRAIEAAESVDEKMSMCREDEPDRVELRIRTVMPEILKKEVPIIMKSIKPKTDWAKNLSIIIASFVIAGGIITGVSSIFGDKTKIAIMETNQAVQTVAISELKKEISEISKKVTP